MFTGIVEDLGVVASWRPTTGPAWDDPATLVEQWELVVRTPSPSPRGVSLFFKPSAAAAGMYVGASVCVSGVCLTVTRFDEVEGTMAFGVAPETVRRTHFAGLRSGDKVNLERAAGAGARNSGHYVQGHVDGVASVVERWREGDAVWFRLKLKDEALGRFVVEKGFVAVDGTSLTVCDVDHKQATFTLMLVQHTQQHVTLPLRNVGDLVNIEVDVMAKYGVEFAERTRVELTARLELMEKKMDAALKRLEERIDALGGSEAKRAKGGGE